MITIESQPLNIATTSTTPKAPPVPVSDCWRWCLQADDADTLDTAGAKATLVVTFPTTPTVPANGSVFKLWGYDFTVQDSSDFTAQSFKVTTSGLATSLNFANMLTANLFFNRAVKIAITISGGFVVTVTWNECREQPRFTVADMVFTALTAAGATSTATNGISPVYVDGFKLITRLGRYVDATSEFLPVGQFSGSSPDFQCDTTGPVCVDYAIDAQSQLYTELPELDIDSFISAIQLGRSLMRLFSLEYGWLYRENCQAKSGTIKKSNIVLGINAAFDLDDPYQMRRYWYDHPDGFPSGQSVVDFLTTQPKTQEVGVNSFVWLWMLNNWQVDFGTYKLVARFILYKKDGTSETFTHVINDPATMGSAWYQPVNFNVSPGFVYDNAPTFTPEQIVYYEVQVVGMDTGLTTTLFNASEYLTFIPITECNGFTDIYFLTSPGGISTLPVVVTKIETEQEAGTVNLSIDCNTDRLTRASVGGRTMTNIRSYNKYTFECYGKRTDEFTRWFTDFKKSPQRWIKVYEKPVTNSGISLPMAKKMIVDPGSIETFINDGALTLRGTGYTFDIPSQSSNEATY